MVCTSELMLHIDLAYAQHFPSLQWMVCTSKLMLHMIDLIKQQRHSCRLVLAPKKRNRSGLVP